MHSPQISIVIPCRNEGPNVHNTVSSILGTPTKCRFEIIVVDDGSTDNCCDFLRSASVDKRIRLINSAGVGACQSRNKGALFSRGEYLLFCDAHIFVEPFWLDVLLGSFPDEMTGIVSPGIASPQFPDVIGYGLTLTETFGVKWLGHPRKISPVLIAPGGCALVKKETFFKVKGFDAGFRIWGHEDVELSIKCWLFGYRVLINPAVKILHVFREHHPYSVSMNHLYYNYLRLALSHFSPKRVKKIIGLIKPHPEAEEVLTDVMFSDVWDQRKEYFSTRLFDDDWLFQKFSVNF